MEYLILIIIIIGIVIYLLRKRKFQTVKEEPRHKESRLQFQGDNRSKIDETNKEIIFCANPNCRQKLRIPITKKELKVTCPICRNTSTYFHSTRTTFAHSTDIECFAYLDIETTSLNPSDGDLTVIGLYLEDGNEHSVIQLVGDEINASKLIEIMKKVKVLYTYNGTTFDLPYIKAKLGIDLIRYCAHKDLMYECWQRNLYGGFKEVERKLGIKRNSTGIDGKVAVKLWNNYKLYGDKRALTTLLDYNREDVSNLRVIRQKLNT